jgi:hypothetical protein
VKVEEAEVDGDEEFFFKLEGLQCGDFNCSLSGDEVGICQ